MPNKTCESYMKKVGQDKFTSQNFYRTETLKNGKTKQVNLKMTESAIGRSKIVDEAFEIAPVILDEFDKKDSKGFRKPRKAWIKMLMQHPNFNESEYDNIPDARKMSQTDGMVGIIVSVFSICFSNIALLHNTGFSLRESFGKNVGKLLFYNEKDPAKQSIYGMALAESVIHHCSFIDRKITVKSCGKKKIIQYFFTKELTDEMSDFLIENLDSAFYGLPIEEKPIDWHFESVEDSTKKKLVGGYHHIQIPFVKTGFNKGVGIIRQEGSERLLSSVNYLQSIPYRINKQMFDDAIIELQSNEPLKEQFVIKIDGEDDKFDEAEYASSWGKYIRKKIILKYIKDYRDVEKFYQVYQIDYRGRVYTASSIISTISDDFGKSMIEFADSYKLTSKGLEWAFASLASLAGADKELFDDRLLLGKSYYYNGDPEEIEEPYQYKALKHSIDDALDGKEVRAGVPFDAFNWRI